MSRSSFVHSTSMAQKRPASGSSRSAPTKKRKRVKPARPGNIWTGRDDWEELVETSLLSTASVSTRAERPRGKRSLVWYASERAARSFKLLWEDGAQFPPDPRAPQGTGGKMGEYWMAMWECLPEHLQEAVRRGVYRYWGGYITENMISKLHSPPTIHLPVAQLPALAKTKKLKPVWPKDPREYTELIVKGGTVIEDVAIAGLLYHMPNVQVINLKGCSLAGERTVKQILKCDEVRRLNLKGTKIAEGDVRALLDRFGQQLEVFKVDDVAIENVDQTFASSPYPKLERLCMPGDILNAPSRDYFKRSRNWLVNGQHPPNPRQTPEGSVFDWPTLSTAFPSLTHLYLPRLLLPETTIGLKPHTLVKLVLGPGAPIQLNTLIDLLETQHGSLKFLDIGQFTQSRSTRMSDPDPVGILEEQLAKCRLEVFKADLDKNRTNNPETLVLSLLNWAPTLKRLYMNEAAPSSMVDVNGAPIPLLIDIPTSPPPILESLELPGAKFNKGDDWIEPISKLVNLRYLDLSNTSVDEDDVFRILDNCPLLSRIDLTSCRGVKVQHRRNIFKAWEESRQG